MLTSAGDVATMSGSLWLHIEWNSLIHTHLLIPFNIGTSQITTSSKLWWRIYDGRNVIDDRWIVPLR